MGEVYRADDTRKGRTVALKILAEQFWQDDKFRTRFQRESRAAAVLQEPHVIPIHDWGEIDGHPYIDMRLVDGQTLQELLSRGPLKPARASHIISGIAAALDAAHAAGLIHRDVKPQNIIVTPSDFPYLVDFGIAEAKGESGLTMTGMQIGTFAYMAPERFRKQDATPAVDVYALTCVLYECLTGDAPFPGQQSRADHDVASVMPPPRPSHANRACPTSLRRRHRTRHGQGSPMTATAVAGRLGRATQRALESDTPVGWSTRGTHGAAAAPSRRLRGNRRRDSAVPRSSGQPISFRPSRPTALRHASARRRQLPASSSRKWLMPTIIAVVAALVLGGIGIVIGLLTNDDSPPVATAPDTPDRATARHGSDKAPGPTDDPPTGNPLGVGAPPPPPLSEGHQRQPDRAVRVTIRSPVATMSAHMRAEVQPIPRASSPKAFCMRTGGHSTTPVVIAGRCWLPVPSTVARCSAMEPVATDRIS